MEPNPEKPAITLDSPSPETAQTMPFPDLSRGIQAALERIRGPQPSQEALRVASMFVDILANKIPQPPPEPKAPKLPPPPTIPPEPPRPDAQYTPSSAYLEAEKRFKRLVRRHENRIKNSHDTKAASHHENMRDRALKEREKALFEVMLSEVSPDVSEKLKQWHGPWVQWRDQAEKVTRATTLPLNNDCWHRTAQRFFGGGQPKKLGNKKTKSRSAS